MSVNLETVLKRNPSAAYRIYDGQATVVLPDRSEVNVLNELGSLVWERIDGSRTVGQIVESVAQEYDVPVSAAREDVLAFIGELREHGMVS
jgi:hypothetical protein